jgi:Tfp pilus assembly protein PilO
MTTRDRTVLMVVVVLAVLGAGWMLVVSPKRKEAKNLESTVSAAKSALSSAEGQLGNARAAQAQYAGAYASVVRLGKAVPASQEVPSLMYQIAHATGQRNVEFNSITSAGGTSSTPASSSATTSASSPAAATAPAAFQQMPFTFVFTGGFFNLEKVFRQITAFTTHSHGGLDVSGRLLTIQSVKLSPEASSKPGSTPKLSGNITATAYVLPASQGLTGGATPTSPTGATATPTSGGGASAPTAPAVARVTP